jgi:hypothetical protein
MRMPAGVETAIGMLWSLGRVDVYVAPSGSGYFLLQPGRRAPAPIKTFGGVAYCGSGSRSRLRTSALTATRTLEPDIEIAPISGRNVNPKGSKTPAAIGRASEL